MQLRHLALVPIILIAACTSKYPFPSQYVSPHEVSARSIPIPPARYSAEYNEGVESIVALQSQLSAEDLVQIKHQDHISPDKMLVPVLGEQYSEERYPVLYDFMKKVASDSWRIGDSARDYWKSPRPWYTESRVRLYVEPIYSYGYPSGHTTTFGTWAYVLADLFPAKREQFFEQAWSTAANRIKGGAHYPHDIHGGKLMAKAVYQGMTQQASYQKDFAAALAEVKAGGRVKQAQLCPENLSACRQQQRDSAYMTR